jgi:RNA polymerase sigma factor (sigma-70 family)
MAARACAWEGLLSLPVPADEVRSGRELRRARSLLSRGASKASASGDSTETSAYARGRDFIERCIAGDPATRAEFVEQYSGLVRFAIASVLRQRNTAASHEEIDDLHQSIMLSFFDQDCRRLKMYEGRNRASFATFVRVCATRLTLDQLRAWRRRPVMVSADDSEPESRLRNLAEMPDPGPGPEDDATATQAIAHLRREIASLSAREQLFVRLHFVDGVEIPTVAGILGISGNAAHVLKSRVRKKLRLALGVDEGG